MSNNIEAERTRQQLSKEALSKILGITSKTYLGYVREDVPIPSNVLIKMSQIFRCSVDYLLGINITSPCTLRPHSNRGWLTALMEYKE